MTFQVTHSKNAGNALSPFRVIEQPMGREVEWINRPDPPKLPRIGLSTKWPWSMQHPACYLRLSKPSTGLALTSIREEA